MSVQVKQPAAEPLLGMREIARFMLAETGHKPGRSTIWRWGLTGRLAYRRIGGRLYTTETAIRNMLATDEQRNRGSVESRGAAAAARHESRMSGRRSA